MTRAQAHLLLSLAENRYDDGTEAINEMRRMGSAHAQRLLEDEEMLKKALEINRQDQARFANYFSQQRPTQENVAQSAIGREQRVAALAHARKAAE